MAINLTKGQRIDLTKTNPGLKKAIIGLGWDTNKYDGGHDFDLDASAFLADANNKVVSDKDFVFYNNLEGGNGGVVHTGDNRTGEGDGDDEQIIIDFDKIPQNIERISITVTIHDAENRQQNFGQVFNSFVRVVDEATNQELLRYDLGEDFSVETVVVVCEIYRNKGEWKFKAEGSGFQGGLAALCRNFGLDVG